jgi:phosphoribosylanthranilate isomerase
MTWVKICGITNLEDALTAVDAGADALGFVFYEKSPRNVAPETVREIVPQLPVNIEKVGVFVGNTPEKFLEIVHGACLTGSQHYFDLKAGSSNGAVAYGAGCFPPGFKSYLAVPAEWLTESKDSASHFISSLARAAETTRSRPGSEAFPAFFQRIFLDSGNLQQPGGTGMAFDWRKAAPMVERLQQVVKVVVAGGLNPTNVSEAIRILQPWGVDVSSGVESKPGKKDPEKVRAFITAVRQAERVA